MGKNQTYKAMQRARLGSSSAGTESVEDGMKIVVLRTITDGWFISFTRVACCSFSQLKHIPHHNMGRIQEETVAFQEDEFKRDELEANKDRMMREYRAQLDAERARKLALGRNHSASKSHHKRVRKSKESNKQSSRKRKHNRSSESSSSSSSESLSSDDDYENGYGGESRRSRLKKKRKHRSRTEHSSSSSRDSEACGRPYDSPSSSELQRDKPEWCPHTLP
ncbi:hypothetical protein ZIOFF_005015 [Zingiber officinale]|uniref:Uncharacterized protein n=2 Tax=Zingiber officinale TaxID=94328 RepID=A0A8J5I981_ZINOF|nr:hypothetical protein ZIOFF_005015 [Zingiber officinale]